MLRAATSRKIAWNRPRVALGVSAAALGGGGGGGLSYYYCHHNSKNKNSNKEHNIASSNWLLGAQRQVRFWSAVAPVFIDYWWHVSASSPLQKCNKSTIIVRMKQLQQQYSTKTTTRTEEQQLQQSADERTAAALTTKTAEITWHQLHKRSAPKLFDVMLQLGGLYIKLGQVLSVTALPIPDEYRSLFRTLQSNVPSHLDFDTVIRPTLEKELKMPLSRVFESFDSTPCGAASIGQAHKAVLKETGEKVIVKVQYPDAPWQVPADIACVGQFLKLLVWFKWVDETAVQLSFDDFARQFLQELDYQQECHNLQQVYQSSLDPNAPYQSRGVVIPKLYPDYCTRRVITMSYLPGPKLEEQARQQLQALGLLGKSDGRGGIRAIVMAQQQQQQQQQKDEVFNEVLVQAAADQASSNRDKDANDENGDNHGASRQGRPRKQSDVVAISASWKHSLAQWLQSGAPYWRRIISVDSIFWSLRLARRIVLLTTAALVTSLETISGVAGVQCLPPSWQAWVKAHKDAARWAANLDWTQEAIHALLDVHGYQILRTGLFNADPHPGNILMIQEEDNEDKLEKKPTRGSHRHRPKIGLIDYGQCKQLDSSERVRIAKLILSVADNESDEIIAQHFRNLGIRTQNDSTYFLAQFAKLMFAKFQPQHLSHDWHKALHKEDRLLYFPKELSMVYRTSLLLRGLAMSLQYNVSVGEQWRHHAKLTIMEDEEYKLQ